MANYDDYFLHQTGSGRLKVFVGGHNQRGHGIGSFLGGLFRRALPFLKKGAQYLGKEALRTGTNILTDVTTNHIPLKEATQMRLHETVGALKRKASDKIEQLMQGSGYKKVKSKRKKQSRRKHRAKKTAGAQKKTKKRTTRKRKTKKRVKKPKRKVVKKRQLEDIFAH